MLSNKQSRTRKQSSRPRNGTHCCRNCTNTFAVLYERVARRCLSSRITKCPLEFSKQVESQAFEKSHGIKVDYFKLIHAYVQKFQSKTQRFLTFTCTLVCLLALYQNRASQQQQQNSQINPMGNQPARFPAVQPAPRMLTPTPSVSTQMARMRESAILHLRPHALPLCDSNGHDHRSIPGLFDTSAEISNAECIEQRPTPSSRCQ